MRPHNSEIIGSPPAAARPASGTGLQRGAPGSATPSSGNASAADPAAVDADLLHRLKLSCGAPVSIRTRWIDPEAGDSYEVLQGIDWPAMTLQQASAALQAIEATMAPAEERTLGALLYELWIATAKASTASEDQQALAAVYIRDLRDFPADIALHVLRQAKRSCHWFPPLADLCQQCLALARKRAALLSSLQGRLDQIQRPAIAPTLQRMPGTSKTAVGFWSIDGSANVERLAGLRGISYREARALLVCAAPADLLELEQAVRQAGNGAPGPLARQG